MKFDEWLEIDMENRRAAVRKTIRPATLAELKELAPVLFPVLPDPWADRYDAFLNDHAKDKFYHARIPNGGQIVYSRDAGRGIWFIPGRALGRIRGKALEALVEIVDSL